MDVLRKAYVRDVVTIKNELTRKEAMTEKVSSLVACSIPSSGRSGERYTLPDEATAA